MLKPKNLKLYKLYEIPKDSKIYGLEPDGDKDGVVIFGHIDGMYSYCQVESDPSKIVHLSAMTPLKAFKDGYVLASEPEGGEK